MAMMVLPVVVTPTARLIYNATASAPLGWYAVLPATQIRVGDVVLARIPAGAEQFADRRGYLPATVPILKRVGALAGQWVCAQDEHITVNFATPVRILMWDGQGRALRAWTGCRKLRANEVFLLSEVSPGSFDSRYFGPIPRRLVIGRTVGLWTW